MTPRRSHTLVFLIIVTSFPLGACTSSHLGAERPGVKAAPGGALITVENQNMNSVRVYLIRGNTPIPLGSVDTLERRTFVVPTSMLGHDGTVTLLADPLGSRETVTTEMISAAPGDQVTWKLAPFLHLSTYSVRRVVG